MEYRCRQCRNESDFRADGGTIFCYKCGALVTKVKNASKGSVDKAELFKAAWKQHAPQNAPKISPEFKFDPERKYRFDFAFPQKKYRIGIEIDGGKWKAGGGRHMSESDYAKRRNAARLGWLLVPFLVEELQRDPAGCVLEVCRVLGIEVQV